jgi:hypothetical protein
MQEETTQDTARQDNTQDTARQDNTRRDTAREATARSDGTTTRANGGAHIMPPSKEEPK